MWVNMAVYSQLLFSVVLLLAVSESHSLKRFSRAKGGVVDCTNGIRRNKRCYAVERNVQNYGEAKQLCSSESLVKLECMDAQKALKNYMVSQGIDRVLIGMVQKTSGEYFWEENSEAVSKRWLSAFSLPGDAPATLSCVVMVPTGEYGDLERVDCSVKSPYICATYVLEDTVEEKEVNVLNHKIDRDIQRMEQRKARRRKDPSYINSLIPKEEKDQDLGTDDYKRIPEQARRRKRNTLSQRYSDYKWTNNIVPYTIDLEGADDVIMEAMGLIESTTCVRFVPYDPSVHNHHLSFYRGMGCWSYIGEYLGLDPQPLSVGFGCEWPGTIAHELMHALGFFHEQSRPDRDNYIVVNYDNIYPEMIRNFEPVPNTDLMTLGSPYDLLSLMHYGSDYFAVDTFVPTISVKNDIYGDLLDQLGQRDFLTSLDSHEINLFYNCQATPEDGGWSIWSEWGPCSLSCGGGKKQRTRTCDYPKPTNGGSPCPTEQHVETKACLTVPCPGDLDFRYLGCFVDTYPDSWFVVYRDVSGEENSVEACAQLTLAAGLTVFALRHDGMCLLQNGITDDDMYYRFLDSSSDCFLEGETNIDRGDNVKYVEMFTIDSDFQIPSQWGPWSIFSLCSANCGGGIQVRTRDCMSPHPQGIDGYIDCVPDEAGLSHEESIPCNEHFCPVDGVFSEWNAWSDCSQECGLGNRYRERTCSESEYGGHSCDGDYIEHEECFSQARCPVFFVDPCQNNQCHLLNTEQCYVEMLGTYGCFCKDNYEGTFCENEKDRCSSNPCLNGGTCTGSAIPEDLCICDAGYGGLSCEENLNECTHDTCEFGSCRDKVDGWECVCYQGYIGVRCETATIECDPDPCDRGSCRDLIGTYSCYCDPGWSGVHCTDDMLKCSREGACINGATCTETETSYECTCTDGYEGIHCEIEVVSVNHCADDPCVEGTCTNQLDGYLCECTAGYDGTNCDNDINECDPEPCAHGICNDGVAGYTCSCGAGYEGTDCEININECFPDPCVHGSCADRINDYECTCDAGYYGKDCNFEINECDPDPCDNGICTDEVNAYRCTCQAGYEGTDCEINIDDCEPNPCVHGNCADQVAGYQCSCQAGYSGDTCNVDINECNPDPCQHGTCNDYVNEYQCVCQAGYTGTNCEINKDECDPNPCDHGICTDGVNAYRCSCEPGYEGTDCDININECEVNPCVNGKCTDGIASYECTCDAGYAGNQCEIDIDDCRFVSCLNGGLCEDLENAFKCNCAAGFSGELCDLEDVDGEWSAWVDDTACSASCGPGTKTQSRECNNPARKNNGAPCDGKPSREIACEIQACPTLGGPVAEYNFEDLFTTSSNVETMRQVSSVEGVQGQALNFDEYGAYASADTHDPWASCIHNPINCVNGFTVSLWIYQSAEQRAITGNHGPNVFLTSGVEPDGATTPENGFGFALYQRVQETRDTKAWVRHSEREYTTDVPYDLFTVNTWHHIAITYSNENGLTMYFKGKRYDWDIDGRDNPNKDLDNIYDEISIGRPLQCDDHYFMGSLDEVKIWANELSAAEIYDVYTSVGSRCDQCDINAVCSNNQCACQGDFSNGDGFYCERSVDPLIPSVDMPAALYYWKMDKLEAGAVVSQGGTRELQAFQEVIMTKGVKDNAIQFDGRRDYFSAGDFKGKCLSSVDVCETGFTVAYWMNFNGRTNTYNFIISSGGQLNSGSTGVSQWISRHNLHTRVQTSTTAFDVMVPYTAYEDQWSHVAVVYQTSPAALHVYVDGVNVGNNYGEAKTADEEGESAFYVAQPNHMFVFNGRFSMDNLAMFESPLNESQVKNMMNVGLADQTPARK